MAAMDHHLHSSHPAHGGTSEASTSAGAGHSAGGAASAGQHQPQYIAPLPSIPNDPSAKEQQAAAKQSLRQWWTKFTKQQQQQQQYQQQQRQDSGSSRKGGNAGDDTSPTSSTGKGVFGLPLTDSLKYAGVAISMVGPDGINHVYGSVEAYKATEDSEESCHCSRYWSAAILTLLNSAISCSPDTFPSSSQSADFS